MKPLAQPGKRSHPPATLPDILDTGLSVIFCGINPGLRSASSGHHFSAGGNRFWRAVHLARFTPELIAPDDDRTILQYGCGLTTAVERPTARASELSKHEFLAASVSLEKKIEQFAPEYVAFLGKVAYSSMSGLHKVEWGIQSLSFGGARVWILPNPSGLNRAFSLNDLVRHYGELRQASRHFRTWL
ncbi:MAG TPA: G/U mismatch-specific DNA glycosylase [Gemmatimonadaceae bacterium]|nr:G/U mismatch-specific DNA glycosylase [Gemmatimonadaceae bacterium]